MSWRVSDCLTIVTTYTFLVQQSAWGKTSSSYHENQLVQPGLTFAGLAPPRVGSIPNSAIHTRLPEYVADHHQQLTLQITMHLDIGAVILQYSPPIQSTSVTMHG